jgi:hypothetical protein
MWVLQLPSNQLMQAPTSPDARMGRFEFFYWLNVKFTSIVVATSTGSLFRKVGR